MTRHPYRTDGMNQSNFIATFSLVQKKMYKVSRRLLTSHEEAADAVQETLLKLWGKREQLEQVRNKEAYAMQMVKNYALDRLKSKQASHLKIVHSNYESDEPNAQQELERQSQVSLVQQMIAQLPDTYRMILHLRDIEYYDFEAIEQSMDMKSTAVRVTLSRARKALKKKIEEHLKSQTA